MSLRRLLALAAAATLVLATAAGCDSDDDGDDADDVQTTSTTFAGGSTTPGGQSPVELSGSVNDHGTGTVESDDEIDLDADDFYFSPTFIQATPGQTVRVEIDNEGSATHTFTSDELQVDEEIAPDEDTSVQITVPQDGAVRFYCRFHSSQGMQGAIFTAAGQSVTG